MNTDRRAFTLVFMGIICGLIWGNGCHDDASDVLFAVPQSIARNSHALLTHDLAAGTNGGTNTGGVWTTRGLNTEVYDPDNIVALAGNQFTLAAGTYLLEAKQAFFSANGVPKTFSGRIRNMTANTTTALAVHARAHQTPGQSVSAHSAIPATYLVLAASATFELQYFAETVDAVNTGLGLATSSGEVERYVSVSIEKLN